jgi:hypothetical protein
MLALNRSHFEKGIWSYNCSEVLGFDHFYVQSPCDSLMEDYTEIFYAIYKWNVPSFQCKLRLRWSMSERSRSPESFLFDFDVTALTPLNALR